MARSSPGLAQILGARGRDAFLARAWPHSLYVSKGHLDARALPEGITDLERIVSAPGVHLSVFGANGFRVDAANAKDALSFYAAGHTLYLRQLEHAVPEIGEFCASLADDLEIDPGWITIEGFASPRKNAGTSMHYDFDLNFNVQLAGTKTWRIAKNEHIDNPLSSMVVVPGSDARSSTDGRRLPTKMPKRAETVRMQPGDALFLPRGHWHETTVHSESFAVAFVIKPPPLFRLVLDELTNTLKQDAAWRAYPIGPEREAMLARVLATLPDVVRGISAEDVLLGQRWLQWRVPPALHADPWQLVIEQRALAIESDLVAAAQWLVAQDEVFALDMCTTAAPVALRALVRTLLRLGAIEVVR
ncbi:MAG: cupin-like domain-containing protein [Deltaproteobacteria bacterium]|nr:cupin-like domain-containing protein [Deltaproteobacteria bacterium]